MSSIQSKSKACKGTGVAKSHGCGTLTMFRKYGMCNDCYRNFLLNTDEGASIIAKTTLKATTKVKADKSKEAAAKRKIEKESIANWKSKLQDKINEIVRLIDWGQPCLARGYHPNQIHAGHIYSRGSTPSLCFNLHNIHRQSAHSNHFQNEDGLLREGLVKEYGDDYFQFLSNMRGQEALKFTNEEYHQLYKKACKIALKLRKDGKVFTLEERILKRNEFNIEIGIYNINTCIYQAD